MFFLSCDLGEPFANRIAFDTHRIAICKAQRVDDLDIAHVLLRLGKNHLTRFVRSGMHLTRANVCSFHCPLAGLPV